MESFVVTGRALLRLMQAFLLPLFGARTLASGIGVKPCASAFSAAVTL